MTSRDFKSHAIIRTTTCVRNYFFQYIFSKDSRTCFWSGKRTNMAHLKANYNPAIMINAKNMIFLRTVTKSAWLFIRRIRRHAGCNSKWVANYTFMFDCIYINPALMQIHCQLCYSSTRRSKNHNKDKLLPTNMAARGDLLNMISYYLIRSMSAQPYIKP